ncbi:MAG: hypothetical protein GY708_06950 [Actinomycetia bacterium]|nr:hypothetical protein [Actinomycetes bacterium]MCP4958229.1 hypothetical protein [Actinomycetes bacterium]
MRWHIDPTSYLRVLVEGVVALMEKPIRFIQNDPDSADGRHRFACAAALDRAAARDD